MQTPPLQPFRLFRPRRHGVLLLALAFLGTACDRHSATEVPESYGHGSSHQDNYTSHKIDSQLKTDSFSDSKGLAPEKEVANPEAAKASRAGEKPVPTPNPMGIGR